MAEVFPIEIDGQVVQVEADDPQQAYKYAESVARRGANIQGSGHEYLTKPDGSFQTTPDGGLVQDPRTAASKIDAARRVDTITNPKKVIPAAAELVGDMAGSIGGALVGAPAGPGAGALSVGGGTTGAGAGRLIGELAVGTPKEEAIQVAKESALWSAAGGGFFELARLGRGWFRGFSPALKPSEISMLKELRPEYEDVARRMGTDPRADQLRDWKVVGQDQDPEQVNLARKIGDSLIHPTNQDSEARRAAGDWEAVYRYLNPSPAEGPSYMADPGQAMQDAFRQEYQNKIGSAEGELVRQQKISEVVAGQIKGTPDTIPIGMQAAIALEEMATKGKAEVDGLYDNYRRLIGQKNKLLPESDTFVGIPDWIKKYASDIHRLANDDGLTESQRRSFAHIAGSLFNTKPIKKTVTEANPDGWMLGAPKTITKTTTKEREVDLAALDDAIIQQGHLVSRMKSAYDPGTSLSRETDLLEALKQWRAQASTLLPQETQAAHNAAQEAYGAYSDKFKNGLVGSLLSYDRDGNIRLADPTKLITLFNNGNIGDVAQVAKLANLNPTLKSELRKLAFAHYRDKVMADGVTIDLKKHTQYMRPFGEGGYRELTQGFFDPKDWKLIETAGGYAKAVVEKEKNLKKLTQEWNEAFGGRFSNVDDLSPQRLVTMAFTTEGAHKAMDPQHIQYAMHLLKKYDEAAVPAYQDAVRQKVVDMVKDQQTGELNLSTLNKILNRSGGTGKNLGVILGNDYVDKLRNVVGYLERSNIRRILPGPTSTAGASVFENLRKGILGPLSHESTIAGLAGGYRKAAIQRAVYEALTNPDALKSMEGFYKRLGIGIGAAGSTALVLKPEDEVESD